MLPVFIISFNRGREVLRLVGELRFLDPSTSIIVHDNGSDDPETLAILNELHGDGVVIEYCSKINSADELNLVGLTVDKYLAALGLHTSNYVVTDCDISISTMRSNWPDLFPALLSGVGSNIECIGPMLTINDLPKSYPLYNHVMNRHISQFWGRRPSWLELNGLAIGYQFCKIDTTFAVHRGGTKFRRLKNALRTYFPYEARHTDWYLTPEKFENSYSQSASKKISHWNVSDVHDLRVRESLIHDQFYMVEYEDANLVERVVHLI